MTARPREGLRDMTPYVSPQLDVAARLNTNESPHPLPPGFFEELAKVVRDLPLHRYPDGAATRLREELGAVHGLPAAAVWAANGSNEVLQTLLLAYGGPERRAITFEPTYSLHGRLCWSTHTDRIRGGLPSDFVLGDPQIDEARAARPDIVFVCSPNNPTGNAQPIGAIRGLAEALPDALLIVDEAYAEFSDAPSATGLLGDLRNLAVVRTFSKAYAMAGARIGYALTSPAIVEDLGRVRLPYHLSALTQAAGICALHHRPAARALLASIRVERDRIAAELTTIPGCVVYPSDANFVLFVPPGDARELWRGLLDRGVLVRDMSDAVPNALRVTAGSEHETDLFLKALRECLPA
ncbi:MAG TPA: histidinol-phosphate transaminase [Actinomycetota bacterium]|nr:histidinol-phosphate transaminase [Actinomycetota bacterium]